jgi:hypothetical protein
VAGLLDSIFPGASGGGLLDFLRNNAMNQQFGSGLQSDQAQYGSSMGGGVAQSGQPQISDANARTLSPLDNAQWPQGPVGSPYQANAQMAQPSQAPAPQSQAPGFADRLNAGFQSIGNGGSIIGALTGNHTDPVSQNRQTQNLTLQALVQKGIDPVTAQAAIGNPELLKTLITQTYGPQTVTPLGNGYVADKSGNIKRAYEPEDKIPAGFAKDEKGNMRYVPGGPADPAYLRLAEAQKKDPNANIVLGRGGEIVKNNPDGTVTVLHKNQEGAGDAASIDDKTAKLLAERVLQGDTKALTGLGRGAQGAANILKIHKMASDIADEKGIDAKGVLNNIAEQAGKVSSARALGTKETHFGVAEKAMEESLPLAQAASDNVPRTDWIHLNKLVQAGQTEHSNPLLKRFLIATDTAAKDYARTINPTGALRESDIEYARKILSTADGPDSYKAALDQLNMEAGVMHRAIQRQKGELYGRGDHATEQPATVNKTKTGVSWGIVK